MIDTLSAEELDQLEAILGKPLDEKTELQMIQAELQQLGMDPQDVQDMFDLSGMRMTTASRITASSTSLAFLTNWDPLASWPYTPSWNLLEKPSWMLSLAAL